MSVKPDAIWDTMKAEVKNQTQQEPALSSFLQSTILDHASLETALSQLLANKLESPAMPASDIKDIIEQALASDKSIGESIREDLRAVLERDSACNEFCMPFLYFKGFQALQCYRIAHYLWQQQRMALAFFFQSKIALIFSIDIHPAAKLGKGLMLDHATGIVIGETTVVEDDVSIMQSVTLGGTGKDCGDRHPKIRKGVLISAGAIILGNIEIGEGAKIGAGSVVLKAVLPHTTVAGVPAVVVGKPKTQSPSLDMNHDIS